MSFRYPKGPDDPDATDFDRSRFERVFRAQGSQDPSVLFGDAPVTPTPWPRAARDKRRPSFDEGLVEAAVRSPHLRDVDPSALHSTQPGITRQGVDYYMGSRYEQTGETFADKAEPGNRYPVVYAREDGQNLILSGHHRAAAALLSGRQLRANLVEGPWGT